MALIKQFLTVAAVAAPLVLSAGVFAPVQAAPLGGYTFTGVGNVSPTTVAPNLTLSNFTPGSGVNPNATVAGVTAAIGWTTDATPDANDFYSFTATVASGYQLSLSNLTLDLTRIGIPATLFTTASSGAPRSWALGTSVGGGPISIAGTGVLSGVNSANSLNVNLASLTGITSPVQFFIYGFDAANGAGILAADNVQLNGTVSAVPTPAVLPALAAFGVGLWRKRKSGELAETEA
jgi:hypothetical protein